MTTSTSFNGLNGDILFNAADLAVGRLRGYGYQRSLLVTVSLRIERLQRRGIYETVEHTHVQQPLDFAITTAVWQPNMGDHVAGGATVGPLRHLVKYAEGFDADKVQRLVELEPWHLNSMQAACAHQEVVWEDEAHRRPSIDLTLPCPITGYKYGSAWLVKELPEGFVGGLLDTLDGTETSRVFKHPDLEEYR